MNKKVNQLKNEQRIQWVAYSRAYTNGQKNI